MNTCKTCKQIQDTHKIEAYCNQDKKACVLYKLIKGNK